MVRDIGAAASPRPGERLTGRLRCEPGDEVVLETRDAFDGQMGPDATLATVAAPNLDVVHPLTGPVFVRGAEPGDVLEVDILDVDAARGRALCIRCCVWALFAVLAVFIVGGVAGYLTRAAAPWGSTVAGVLLIVLVGLAARQRAMLQARAGW
jgi:hypothetical protein